MSVTNVAFTGIDHASASGIDFEKAKSKGYSFTMRYLRPNRFQIGAAERDRILRAEIGLGLIWELEAARPLEGGAVGEADGARARAEAQALGAPSWLRILYNASETFEPTDQQLRGPIADYCRGFTEHAGPVMPYGPYKVIESVCGEQNINPFGWQSAGNSGSGIGSGGSFACMDDTVRRLSRFAAMFQDVGGILTDTDHNVVLASSPATQVDWAWGHDLPLPIGPGSRRPPAREGLMSRAVGSTATGDGQFIITPTSHGLVRVHITTIEGLSVLKRADVIEDTDPIWLEGADAMWFASLPVGT